MNRLVSAALMAVAAAVSLGAALPASAQFAKPEDAIKYRKAVMTMMETHFGPPVRHGQRASIPFDAKAAAENADIAAAMSKLAVRRLRRGQRPGRDARPAEDLDRARQVQGGCRASANEDIAKLDVAAQAPATSTRMKAAVGEIGKSCKACHDAYRKE